MKENRLALLVYLFILAGTAALIGSVFLAPYLKSQSLKLNTLVYAVFAPVCHQLPSRSFHLFGHPLAVCGRCLGIYAGFFASTLLYPLSMNLTSRSLPGVRTFMFFSAPIVLDTAANFFHLWMTPNGIRFFIGLIWGFILPYFSIPGLVDFFSGLHSKKRRTEKR